MQNISFPDQIQPLSLPLLQSSPLILYLQGCVATHFPYLGQFAAFDDSTIHRKPSLTNRTTAILPVIPKPISSNSVTEYPVDPVQLQTSTTANPTDAAVGDDDEHPKSSPLYFPPSDPFESEDENEVPSASMTVSEPHHSERDIVAAVTSARLTKCSGQKKSGTNIT